MVTKKPTFEPRIRFNWGYHDGRSDHTHSKPYAQITHCDPTYRRGYEAGYYYGDEDLSDKAWKTHLEHKNNPFIHRDNI